MNKVIIGRESEQDYDKVEEITREAFWNLYIPGCDEYYLVHKMKKSSDFIPELTLVAEVNGQIAGSIFFTKSYILDQHKVCHETITFEPVSVCPKMQNEGIGKALIEHAKKLAVEEGYKAILIYRFPDYYKRLGFSYAKEFGISNPEGKYPLAHMVLELYEGA